MTQILSKETTRQIINPSLSDIFNIYGDSYISKFSNIIPSVHIKSIEAIKNCRTKVMGGEVYKCPKCKHYEYSYHSCNNRNCPKCGGDKTIKWAKKQFDLLLPVKYYFITFTLPSEFRMIVRSNPEFFLRIFFFASSTALKTVAKNKRFAGGDIGFMGLLETWARNLIYHPHIHYIVPGAALVNSKKWKIINKKKMIVHSDPLSAYFKKTFRSQIKNTDYDNQIPTSVWNKDWVIDCQPAGTGKEVIKYLAPYVNKVALSNSNIKKLENGFVTYEYKDSKTKTKVPIKLSVFEFMGRFLQHVLPSGFMKIRYFGIMGSNMKDKWYLLKLLIFHSLSKKEQRWFLQLALLVKNKKNHKCPKCNEIMVHIESFLGGRYPVRLII